MKNKYLFEIEELKKLKVNLENNFTLYIDDEIKHYKLRYIKFIIKQIKHFEYLINNLDRNNKNS